MIRSVSSSRRPIDVAPYVSIVDRALQAFTLDPGYAEQMISAAKAIEHKRKIWGLRKEVKELELDAQKSCTTMGPGFRCTATGPCGFGDCPFAHTSVVVISTAGRCQRPCAASYPSYDREEALKAVLACSA